MFFVFIILYFVIGLNQFLRKEETRFETFMNVGKEDLPKKNTQTINKVLLFGYFLSDNK